MSLKTQTFDGNKHMSDVVKYDVQSYSRDDAIIASGSGELEIGTVLGVVSASGKFKPVNPDATTGEQVAAAVLLTAVDASEADADAVVLSRHATVADGGLIWPSDITDAEKASAVAELAAVGIISRKEV